MHLSGLLGALGSDIAPCLVQDIGEGLLALLHYPERQQLVAVTNSGSAIILANSTADDNKQTAAEWRVLMKVKFAGTAGGAKLQVSIAKGVQGLKSLVNDCALLRISCCSSKAMAVLRMSQSGQCVLNWRCRY